MSDEFTWPEVSDERKYKDFTEGTYLVRVEDAHVSLSEAVPQISYKFKVVDGEMANYHLWKKTKLNEKGKEWAAKEFNALMLPTPTSVENLGSLLSSLVGKLIEVYVKPVPQKKDPTKQYNNTYINGLVNHAPTTPTPSFDTDEEIPF